MSFYMGGQRFKSQAPTVSQPPPGSQPPLDAPEVHPLRQHSISQDGSPTISAKQPTATDPTSYAARAQIKPLLTLDLSPSQARSTSNTLTGLSADPHTSHLELTPSATRRQAHKPSVPDRSPLQKLEVTLGDISKEEKRARVEEAERTSRAKKEGAPGLAQSIPRKPIGSLKSDDYPSGSRHSSQENKHRLGSYSPSRSRAERKLSLGLDPFPSRDRQFGYDASRTGGAAAAAVGAYQAVKRPHYRDTFTSYDEEQPQQAVAQIMRPDVDYEDISVKQRAPQHAGEDGTAPSTGNRKPSAIPKAQKLLGEERVATHINARAAINGYEPTALQDIQKSLGHEQQEIAGLDQLDIPHEEYGGRGGRLKFSQVIHPFSDGTGRRYKEGEYLQDWRNAATATLTADDLSLEPSDIPQSTWWEKGQGSRRPSRGRTPAHFTAGAEEGDTGRTAFNPPLSLKCGPLLRYTGIRGDKDTSTIKGRAFWRGTVMIVTEDATSSNEAPPTLRLFRQAAAPLLPSNSSRAQADDVGATDLSGDPIAGQTKCGPRGETLYVKHVSRLAPEADLSLVDGEAGLFTYERVDSTPGSEQSKQDGERLGRYREVKGHRLHHERGLTFWRFNIEVELGSTEFKIAYRINGGLAIGFWVPAKGQSMNIMFHSCNGFSLSVDSGSFSGPDPLWRDVLNAHQRKPFHVMIGGGDQIYNDAAMRGTHHFAEWLAIRNPEHKYTAPFSEMLQEELEIFYLHRYAMWFSQGLFGLANSQIPMVNIWDDHDIIDGYGSYPHHFMSCPVFTGLGAVAFKYYMLFQHQSLPAEDQQAEPSWILGPSRGPYINQHSRSLFLSLGRDVALIGIDCRTERMRDEVLSHETYEVILERLKREVQKGGYKHLIVLLGIPIAYPRMTFAENILTSRAMDPIKAIARTGLMGSVLNKFDGGVEILDDLDDHWTAKHHKTERNWLIEDLQDFAAERSVRITILGGDVHLAAVGQFYTKRKLAVPKDHDHRYMPNIISSAIVNTPPPEAMADFLNKRNKVHHMDSMTDEDMIPLFTYDVNGQDRNNQHLLPRRNYCMLRPYAGDSESPPPSVFDFDDSPPKRRRSFSLSRRNSATSQDGGKRPGLLRRLSNRVAPPSSYRGAADNHHPYHGPLYSSSVDSRVDGTETKTSSQPASISGSSTAAVSTPTPDLTRSNSFLRRPNIGADAKAWAKDPTGRQGHINLAGGLEVTFCCEINQKDPAGKTQQYRLIVPALEYQRDASYHQRPSRRATVAGLLGSLRRNKSQHDPIQAMPYEDNEPATPAIVGDQRYTTMMENQGRAATLKDTSTANTGPAEAAQALGGTVSHEQLSLSPQDLRERATLDSLPRSGVIETEMPAEVPRQPYHEQRRGSLDQHRAHVGVGRSRSLTDRSNSMKRAQAEHTPETAEDRAYWGAQQVRGEMPKPQDFSAKKRQDKGLRRYYVSPFDSSKKHDGELDAPSQGSAPLLGAVNNRVDLMPIKVAQQSPHSPVDMHRATSNDRRVINDPVQKTRQTSEAQGSSKQHMPHNIERPAEKDPYAHYLPEAVEAEFQSDDDISDLEAEMNPTGRGAYDDASDVSSLVSNQRSPQTFKPRGHRESFVSAQTNTSLAQNRGRGDSPLYSDEDDLDNMATSRVAASPEPPPRSPARNRHSQPRSRPLSKTERLTGASSSGQRASYASRPSVNDDGTPMARPVGQGASGKAAKMLGADPDEELNAYSKANGLMRTQSERSGGKFSGLVRRLSRSGR